MYSLDEQEININKGRTDGKFHVYTNDSTQLTRLLKFAEPIDPEYDNEGKKIISAQFELDFNQVILRKKPKKMKLSEEEKLRRSERMKRLHNK